MEERSERREEKNSNFIPKTLNQEALQKIFLYNFESGELIRRSTGKVVKSPHNSGGLQVNINGGVVKMVHRVIWCYMTGEWPEQIDHINGNPKDNRWINLRKATNTQNSRNSRKPKNNTSGYKGVSFIPRLNKYRATIMVNRKSVHLGCFSDPKEAAAAYNDAALDHFGEFALLNDLGRG